MIDFSIITVTYNSKEVIKSYLESVLKYLPKGGELIIVDNASTDDTVDVIKSYPSVILIQEKSNLGFSKANNVGAKLAKGEYLFFLNPDIRVVDFGFEELLSFIKDNKQIGLVAPQLISKSQVVQPSVRKKPTIQGVINEFFLGRKNSYSEYVPSTKTPIEVDCVYAAAILVSRDIFLKIKGFDERYFLYYEDLDICRKIQQIGLRIIYYPKIQFIHMLGTSTRKIKQSKLPFGVRTLANFFPIKRTGSNYYQIISGNIYHGNVGAFLIRLILYIAGKLKLLNED